MWGMTPYQTKVSKLSGTSYSEMMKHAKTLYASTRRKTKRRPYIRSAFFKKEKIFFDFFWNHLFEKSFKQRVSRLRYFPCALELIERSRNQPVKIKSPHQKDEVLYRFIGITNEGELFYVQIKEDIKSKHKYLMSVFPVE